jgi:hypothetical protein
MYELYNHKTGYAMGKTFPTKAEADKYIRYLQAGTSLKLHWKSRKVKVANPDTLCGTVHDIPSTWTPVMVRRTRAGGQIKMRGR